MKHIEVVAAVIERDGLYFATQRGYGEFKDFWEFPGGKIEAGECPEDALRREIREELAVEIRVEKLIRTIDCDYPDFHLTLHCFLCRLQAGEPILREHESARWLSREHLAGMDWLPADKELINYMK